MRDPYANDELMAENNAEVMRLTQPLNMTAIEYVKLLRAKKVHFSRKYYEHVLNGNFVKGLQDFIRQDMRSFWCWIKHATLQDLTSQAASLTSLKNVLRPVDGTPDGNKPKNCCNKRRGQTAAEMVLDPDGPWTPPIYITPKTSNTTPVMIIQLSKH